ncbi:MAG: DNA polymerase III subunit gamma/tau, partial [Gammaproteobacteria bacterium]
MSYEVLARKWRPRTFSTLEGQDHVVRALTNALDQDRVHHAFLFTGTRGVGKTTVARIFAKALNCEQGVSSEPCGQCESCKAIDEGRFIDLMEVDAASRTGVDNMRELLDNVQYAPSSARFKVYLIDEVHMLSTHSFNALLKTLEEPPPHVKFLLATTDPQKLLPTVLSRCLQFNLKRLPMRLIADHLGHILQQEGVDHEPPALNALARAADGSMRDGLTLLDQAIAFSNGSVTREGVDAMLGSIGRDHIHQLINAVADGDGPGLLAAVEDLSRQVPAYGSVLAEIIGTFQRTAVVQAVPDAAPEDWDDREEIVDFAARLSPEVVQLYYQIALNGYRDLPHAPDERAGFEMIMLRMLAFRPDKGSSSPGGGAPPVAKAEVGTVAASRSKPGAASASASSRPKVDRPPPPPRSSRRSGETAADAHPSSASRGAGQTRNAQAQDA